MKESEFYELLERVERLEDATDGYFPTVEELIANGVEKNPEKFIPLLSYFSTDPFTRNHIEGAETKDYLDTVTFCKKLLYKLDLKYD